jgi:arabinofuranosyltransferase
MAHARAGIPGAGAGVTGPDARARELPRAVLALLLLVFVAVLVRTAWISDDGLISLRTVLNVTHGNGLTFNVGERVQTFTHPLWLALLTAVYLVIRNVYYAAFALSIAVSVWVFWLAVSRAASTWQAWVAAAALLSSRAFVDYCTSGLENPLANLLLAAFVALFLQEGRDPVRRLTALWGLASLLYLTRPDVVLIVTPLLLAASWRVRRGTVVARAAALGLLPALAWTAFAVVYYGFPFPNTAYAKLGVDISRVQIWKQGAVYAIDSIDRDPLTLILVGFAMAMAMATRAKGSRALAAGIAIYLVYVASIGGDFMSGRFFAVPLFAAVLILTRMTGAERNTWIAAIATCVVLGAVSARMPLMSDSRYEDRGSKHGGIVDERVFYLRAHSLVYASMVSFADPDWGVRRPPGETQVLNTCGLMGEGGLDFGPNFYLLDECALADPLLARLPAIFKEEWRPGHFKRAVPDGYRESVAAGVNLVKDPQLHEFYDQLSRITRSKQLWARDRLWAIWKMNTGGYARLVNRDFYRFSGSIKTLAEMSDVKAAETPWDAPGNTVLKQPLAVRVDSKPGRRYADVSLDSDDEYALIFIRGNAAVGRLQLGPIPAYRRKPGLASYTIDVPSRAERGGFDIVLVAPSGGDEKYSVGHLIIDGNPATDGELLKRVAARDERR